jgi:predicted secreted protein
MMKRSLLAVIAALTILVPASAGDIATFVDLGFSPDSAYFMFGQYGVESASGKPYAELYLVDTKKNDFVPKGMTRKVFDAKLEPGQDCSGALFSLFGDSVALSKSCKIDHLATGRLLYVLLDGEVPPASLSFRDFKTEAAYDMALQKSVAEGKDGVVSSFGLTVTVTAKDGGVKRVTAGSPDIKRPGVRDYAIRRIIVAPDEKTIVVIIEKRMADKGDQSVRYMVETVKLP